MFFGTPATPQQIEIKSTFIYIASFTTYTQLPVYKVHLRKADAV